MGQPCCKQGSDNLSESAIQQITDQAEEQSKIQMPGKMDTPKASIEPATKDHAGAPPAKAVGILKPQEDTPEMSPEPVGNHWLGADFVKGEVIKVSVSRGDANAKWGLVWCETESEPGILRVKSIRPNAAFAKYNASCPPGETLVCGDRVFEINGVSNEMSVDGDIFKRFRDVLHTSVVADIKVLKFPRKVTVSLSRQPSQPLGLEVGNSLIVQRVVLDGKLDVSNQANRASRNYGQVIHEGMQILSVNGATSQEEVRRILENEMNVTIVLDRQIPHEKEYCANP